MDGVPRSNRPRRDGRPVGRGGPGSGRGQGGPGRADDDEDGGLRAVGGGRIELHRGERYVVRPVSGAAATKAYRCPGCDQEIPAGRPHVVAWPLDGAGGDEAASDRRHWHTPCWNARHTRLPHRR